jgi:hypothetical protein
MLKCAPLPVRLTQIFGMNEAKQPCLRAISCAMNRKKVNRSAMTKASAYPKSVSNWPTASSWSNENTSHPSRFIALTSSSITG